MSITSGRMIAPVLLALGVAACGPTPTGRVMDGGFIPTTANGEWQSYTGDARGTRYSPLDQINADNFSDLEVAWTAPR